MTMTMTMTDATFAAPAGGMAELAQDRTSIVGIQGLSKRFGAFEALRDIDLDIRKGEILTFLGPSGCGKTTLMRIIAGFETPSAGRLLLHGRDMAALPPERRPVNMVFQRYALFPHLDVFDNVAFGLRIKKRPETEVRQAVTKMLSLVQLDGMSGRWIHELSGGQSQRVALARALVNQPEVLLLDEPLAALDLKIRHHMLAELQRIQRETGTTFVYVTHDQDEAMILSSRIVLMRSGMIEQLGTPDDLYVRPRTLFAARFLGETNILPARVADRDAGSVTTEFAGGRLVLPVRDCSAQVGDKVHLSIRPETITFHEPGTGSGIRGTLLSGSRIGSRSLYVVALADGTEIKVQTLRSPEGHGFEPGQAVQLTCSPGSVAMLVD